MGLGIRRVVLSFVAIFALIAASGDAASAANFQTETVSATLSGSQEGENVLKVGAGEVKCATATFSGAKTELTSPEQLLSPAYEACKLAGAGVATVDLKSCQFRFRIATPNKMDIVCPTGKKWVVESRIAGILKCTLEIGPQAGLTGPANANAFNTTNLGSGTNRKIMFTIQLAGIAYTEIAGIGVGACVSQSGSNGTYIGSMVMGAKNSLGLVQGFFTVP